MIPKVIHYCWFGGNPLPKSALKCIESWKKFLPDYEIKEWNESNFDVNMIPYTQQAYEAKKYAYVSDYARFWILHQYGGLYFDTDVELIRPIDDIIERGNFMGLQSDPKIDDASSIVNNGVNPGLGLGVAPGLGLLKKMLDMYEQLDFNEESRKNPPVTIVEYTTEAFLKEGLKPVSGIQYVADCYVYPKEYFNPIEHVNQLNITPNTRSIHHFAGSWLGWKDKMKKRIAMILGPHIFGFLIKLRDHRR
ncbi:glycosyltransferase family 32 protein [Prevotella sp. AGR2160]|uniref:glycosyltransferase family 32 protein n=1 Tax=Prevotella sp. AGR2160 TaxID=1280674 RepID=UPI0004087DD9|nr:glycosyltransferase [Prevotella sp. AGR2160]